ncbi:putative ribonuclease H-like domain-containing protein [Tanacetum coccineum]
MEEYVNKTRGDYYSGITKTMINGKDAYELKGKFLDDLRNNAFSRTNGEDAVEHIENFLKNVDPLDLPNVSYERLRLAVFPISLPGDASEWLMNEPQSSITTWVDLTDKFFGKYYPPSRTRRNDDEAIREERKPNDDYGIDNFDNDLVRDSAPYHANEEEEQYEEDMCELLGNPRQEPWVAKLEEIYSFGTHIKGKPLIDDKGFVDSGCSRHMTGNIAYLSDFKEFDGDYVTFRGGAHGGRISGKGTLKTGSLDFKDIYFVNELKFNLFSVSQMCDKKNYVLFTDTECFILSPNFKLPDETQILLKIPRKDNMYSFDMKNIVPKKSLTCLVTKRERGFKPALSFMRPFGCHVTILNTLDNLGKFDGKSDEGFFVGYSLSSKAFRVYNTRTRRVEENLHIGFLENKPMIEGNGPKWLFDIDSLTQSMNYVPVVAGTITNESAGTQGELNTGTSTQKEEISQDCIVMPIWKDASYFDSPSKDVGNGEPKSAADDQKQVEDGPDNENDEKDKSEDDSSPKEVNTAGQQLNPQALLKLYLIHIGWKQCRKNLCNSNSNRLHQAPRAWYETLANYQLGNGFKKREDQTLFIKKQKGDILLVHVYVDDIIFGSTNKNMITIQAEGRRISISQDKYVDEILKKFNYTNVKLGNRLISWQCKKQTMVATSTTEVEYVAAASCCGQVLWIQNQLLDYGYNFMNTMIHIDNNSTICIIENPVQHSKTKHIEIRHHFIRDCNAKKLIQMVKIDTEHNVADLLTKGFDAGRISIVGDEAVYKKLGDIMESAATTAFSIEAEQDSGTDIAKITRKRSKPDKHGHGNGRTHKEPGECYQSTSTLTYGLPCWQSVCSLNDPRAKIREPMIEKNEGEDLIGASNRLMGLEASPRQYKYKQGLTHKISRSSL